MYPSNLHILEEKNHLKFSRNSINFYYDPNNKDIGDKRESKHKENADTKQIKVI